MSLRGGVVSACLFLAACLAGCASDPASAEDEDSDEGEARTCRIPTLERKLDFSKKTATLEKIKAVVGEQGMPGAALIIAGIGAHETGLVQCWKDARYHCQGPYSAACGGPVLAGSGDGACGKKQGGLGIFQFDAGTHDRTLATYGQDILTEEGNARAGVKLIIEKLKICPLGPRTRTDAETIEWLDGVRVDTPEYESYLDAMARCYNGAGERTCRFKQVRASYDAAIRFLLEDGKAAFWYPERLAASP
jgi:hypothetical protein